MEEKNKKRKSDTNNKKTISKKVNDKTNINKDNIDTRISRIPKEDIYRSYNISKKDIDKNNKVKEKKVSDVDDKKYDDIVIKVKDEQDIINEEKSYYRSKVVKKDEVIKEEKEKEIKGEDMNIESKEMNNNVKKSKGRKIKNIIIIIILLVALGSIGYSVYKIFGWHEDNKHIEEEVDFIYDNTTVEEVPSGGENEEVVNPPEEKEKDNIYWDYIKIPLINVDFSNLLDINPDTVGWIYVANTNINYPVVQASNNKYYLTHSFTEEYNDAGWVFMDYRNKFGDKNVIIYGHSRYDGSVFGTLRKVLTSSWQNNKNNHIIKLSTPTENTLWQIYSVYRIKEESYYIKTDFSGDEYDTWLKDMVKRSEYKFNTSVNKDDKTLTLSSCYDTNGTRVVVHAKLIKKEAR